MCSILYKQKQSKAREPMRAQWLLRMARSGRYAYPLLQDPVKRFAGYLLQCFILALYIRDRRHATKQYTDRGRVAACAKSKTQGKPSDRIASEQRLTHKLRSSLVHLSLCVPITVMRRVYRVVVLSRPLTSLSSAYREASQTEGTDRSELAHSVSRILSFVLRHLSWREEERNLTIHGDPAWVVRGQRRMRPLHRRVLLDL